MEEIRIVHTNAPHTNKKFLASLTIKRLSNWQMVSFQHTDDFERLYVP